MPDVEPLLPRDVRILVRRLEDPAFPEVEKRVIRTFLALLASHPAPVDLLTHAKEMTNAPQALSHHQAGR